MKNHREKYIAETEALDGEVSNPGDPNYFTPAHYQKEAQHLETFGFIGGLLNNLNHRATEKASRSLADAEAAEAEVAINRKRRILAWGALNPDIMKFELDSIGMEVANRHRNLWMESRKLERELDDLEDELENAAKERAHRRKMDDLRRQKEQRELEAEVFGRSTSTTYEDLLAELEKAHDEYATLMEEQERREKEGEVSEAAMRVYHDRADILDQRVERLKGKLAEL